jgi:hypothetical protein
MCYRATILATLLVVVPTASIELFRYRGAAKGWGALEYIFETAEQNLPMIVSEEKASEIAADRVTTFSTYRPAVFVSCAPGLNLKAVSDRRYAKHDESH